MDVNLTKYEIADLFAKLKKSEKIPEEYKHKLFPIVQKEYELVYGGKMRKEDILANEDGIFPVPLQVGKIFNSKRKTWEDGWQNMIAYGDNLQFLKTIYENKDPLIKDKVKGKVKLIYIDPPFATESDFNTSDGKKAYADKAKGADFVEFVRRRIIVAKELLKDDGIIAVHLDWKKGHYIKLILDEIFGENNFINEIVWHYTGNSKPVKSFPRKHDLIYLYYKDRAPEFNFDDILEPYSEATLKRYNHIDEDGKRYKISALSKGVQEIVYAKDGKYPDDVWNIPVPRQKNELVNYPTQKPEDLLVKLIKGITKEGEIVMDFFGGSGTTAAVAEKLNRKWISCDIGKLSFYTIQKRILNIQQTKLINDVKKKYGKRSKSFVTVNTGQYDLEKVFNLKSKEYSNFVLNLFEIEPVEKEISGIKIDGERKDGYYALIWPYWEFKDASIDEEYLYNLHSNIGKKIGDRVYIVAPASYVDFMSDYFEIGDVRYYFLKVPYHIIKELHKVQFKKFRQPQSQKNINDLESAIGFHFMKQPEVETKVKIANEQVKISIKKFYSDFSEDDKGRKLKNFESIAMVLIDKSFDGEAFDMDEYYFAEDLLPNKKSNKGDENVGEKLKKTKEINLPLLAKSGCGKTLMIIYVDVFGNEFKENFEIG